MLTDAEIIEMYFTVVWALLRAEALDGFNTTIRLSTLNKNTCHEDSRFPRSARRRSGRPPLADDLNLAPSAARRNNR